MDEAYERLPVVVRCAFCPEWSWEGECKEGREKALQHRTEAHPETFGIKSKRRKKQHLNSFRHPPLNPDERAEIDGEIKRRARLHGVEVQE